jgi:hypothetical protein
MPIRSRAVAAAFIAALAFVLVTPATAARSRKSAPQSSGSETRSERDKRLRRECRGERDAGVCKGYGSWY